MAGHEPGSRALHDGARMPAMPGATRESTIGAGLPGAPSGVEGFYAVRDSWVAGRLALVVAGIGLLGAAAGSLWFGVAERLGFNPGGVGGLALVLVAATLLVLGVLLVLGGIGYYVLAPAFMGPGMAWYDIGSHRLVVATTILIVLLANAGPLAYMALLGVKDLRSLPGLLTAALSVDVALLAIVYLRFIRPGILTRANLGFDRSRLAYHVGIGLLVGVGALIVSGLIQTAMRYLGVQQTQLAGLQYIREFPLVGFLAVAFTGGILAPIAEELYFRGFVFGTYRRTRGPLVSYGITSLVFASLHLNLPALLPILVLSVILCYTYERTGSIVPGTVGHAVNNCTAFVILYFSNGPLGSG